MTNFLDDLFKGQDTVLKMRREADARYRRSHPDEIYEAKKMINDPVIEDTNTFHNEMQEREEDYAVGLAVARKSARGFKELPLNDETLELLSIHAENCPSPCAEAIKLDVKQYLSEEEPSAIGFRRTIRLHDNLNMLTYDELIPFFEAEEERLSPREMVEEYGIACGQDL